MVLVWGRRSPGKNLFMVVVTTGVVVVTFGLHLCFILPGKLVNLTETTPLHNTF